jgi:hypothetical protein
MVHHLSRAPTRTERLPFRTVKRIPSQTPNFDPGRCFHATPARTEGQTARSKVSGARKPPMRAWQPSHWFALHRIRAGDQQEHKIVVAPKYDSTDTSRRPWAPDETFA